MELPPLAPVPPSPVRNHIPNEEWEACLDAWIALTELRLRISAKEFGECAAKDAFYASFLSSYFQQMAASNDPRLHAGQKARNLRRLNFLLTKRLLLEVSPTSPELLDWKFLGDLSICYHSSSAFRAVISEVWARYQETITSSLDSGKSAIMKQLSASASLTASDLLFHIRRLTVLASALPAAGHVLMTGSDFLDAIYDAYKSKAHKSDGEALRSALIAIAYVGLTSLLKGPKPNLSLLLDHLFTLKVAAGVDTPDAKKEPVLLSDLVCSTDMLTRMERYLISFPQRRGQDLVATLRAYQRETKPLHNRYQKHKRKDKGKGRAHDGVVEGEFHAHKMSLITQIQDLFPDLGSGYLARLLDFYDDNVETVIAHLLDGSLPPELQSLDKSEQLPDAQLVSHDVMEPRPTSPEVPPPPPPPLPSEPTFTRRINLDDDEIVEAARSGDAGRKVHFGRANAELTADAMLADRSQHAANKAAILSALATFDSDDDERDDTYDVADVGGTVDSVPTGTDAEAEQVRRDRAEETEMTLFRAYKSNPEQFARNSATRRSQPRTALKRETGMTDEAIEGWALMLERDPKRKSRLEAKLALEAGGRGGGGGAGAVAQPELPSTSYRRPNPKDAEADTETTGEEEAEETSDGAAAGGRGRGGGGGPARGRGGGGRGRGDGRGGRGGSRGGGRGKANHHRRDQHAKKMARAGALPG
ncbi:hypothetical protein VTN96DRAFT_8791 [Rasamsonia emersonii]|uniref:CUE domain protein n=1 Tax=Rasamsonia emersonii (strain ATCC 16479 / CBS 393.64 / IMI 116815) TaxID=1408163 RepID=A0A0F4Z596_RASE3|nr:CUE domain protein [Rasamsonia emersonii CBS 393.64]KKA25515.1 CUE domain protein [Rasamsonia emersonii CBS 393.64]